MGKIVAQSGVTYVEAVAEYNVPFVANTTTSAASMWTGLGGADPGDNTVIQDGIEMDYVAGTGPVTFAWIEYFVNQNLGATPIKEYNVNQGDLMYLGCWVSDSRGNPNPSGGFATFEMDDLFPPAIQPASSQFKNQAGGPHTWE